MFYIPTRSACCQKLCNHKKSRPYAFSPITHYHDHDTILKKTVATFRNPPGPIQKDFTLKKQKAHLDAFAEPSLLGVPCDLTSLAASVPNHCHSTDLFPISTSNQSWDASVCSACNSATKYLCKTHCCIPLRISVPRNDRSHHSSQHPSLHHPGINFQTGKGFLQNSSVSLPNQWHLTECIQ